MTEAHPAHSTRRARRYHEGATPSIAIMALLTGLGGSSRHSQDLWIGVSRNLLITTL